MRQIITPRITGDQIQKMPEILSIGECMIELFSEEPIEEAHTFTRSLAGDSFNILVAAQRLGTSTGYVTRLGDDPFAGYLLQTWEGEGIDTSHVRKVPGFNAVHFVSLLPGSSSITARGAHPARSSLAISTRITSAVPGFSTSAASLRRSRQPPGKQF